MLLKTKKLIYLFIFCNVLLGCNNSEIRNSEIEDNNKFVFIDEIINLQMHSLKKSVKVKASN